jgi:hypothetical protein
MKRVLIAALFGASALAAALPAAAAGQDANWQPGYGYDRGYDGDDRGGYEYAGRWGGGADFRRMYRHIEEVIDHGLSDGSIRPWQANRFRRELWQIRRLERDYWRDDGWFNRWERRDIYRRLRDLHARVDRSHERGHDEWDRGDDWYDRYGR